MPSCDWAVTAAGMRVSRTDPWRGWLRSQVVSAVGMLLGRAGCQPSLLQWLAWTTVGTLVRRVGPPQSACLTVAVVGLLLGGTSSWHSWLTGPRKNCCGHAGQGG